MKYIEDEGTHLMRPVLEHKIPCAPLNNILPNDFEFVYVYVDMNTEEVAYIGRVKSPKRAGARIHDHRCEKWYHKGEYAIAFIPCVGRWESEWLETLLINRYEPKYNKDKKGWGRPIDDNPVGSCDDINTMRFMPEKSCDQEGVKETLTIYQEELKKLMLESGDWQIKEA